MPIQSQTARRPSINIPTAEKPSVVFTARGRSASIISESSDRADRGPLTIDTLVDGEGGTNGGRGVAPSLHRPEVVPSSDSKQHATKPNVTNQHGVLSHENIVSYYHSPNTAARLVKDWGSPLNTPATLTAMRSPARTASAPRAANDAHSNSVLFNASEHGSISFTTASPLRSPSPPREMSPSRAHRQAKKAEEARRKKAKASAAADEKKPEKKAPSPPRSQLLAYRSPKKATSPRRDADGELIDTFTEADLTHAQRKKLESLYAAYCQAVALRGPLDWEVVGDLLSKVDTSLLDKNAQMARLRKCGFNPLKCPVIPFTVLVNYALKSPAMYEDPLPKDEQETVDAFACLGGNKDKSGFITTDTLRTVLDNFRIMLDVQAMLDEVDSDGSGTIEYEEFAAFYSKKRRRMATRAAAAMTAMGGSGTTATIYNASARPSIVGGAIAAVPTYEDPNNNEEDEDNVPDAITRTLSMTSNEAFALLSQLLLNGNGDEDDEWLMGPSKAVAEESDSDDRYALDDDVVDPVAAQLQQQAASSQLLYASTLGIGGGGPHHGGVKSPPPAAHHKSGLPLSPLSQTLVNNNSILIPFHLRGGIASANGSFAGYGSSACVPPALTLGVPSANLAAKGGPCGGSTSFATSPTHNPSQAPLSSLAMGSDAISPRMLSTDNSTYFTPTGQHGTPAIYGAAHHAHTSSFHEQSGSFAHPLGGEGGLTSNLSFTSSAIFSSPLSTTTRIMGMARRQRAKTMRQREKTAAALLSDALHKVLDQHGSRLKAVTAKFSHHHHHGGGSHHHNHHNQQSSTTSDPLLNSQHHAANASTASRDPPAPQADTAAVNTSTQSAGTLNAPFIHHGEVDHVAELAIAVVERERRRQAACEKQEKEFNERVQQKRGSDFGVTPVAPPTGMPVKPPTQRKLSLQPAADGTTTASPRRPSWAEGRDPKATRPPKRASFTPEALSGGGSNGAPFRRRSTNANAVPRYAQNTQSSTAALNELAKAQQVAADASARDRELTRRMHAADRKIERVQELLDNPPTAGTMGQQVVLDKGDRGGGGDSNGADDDPIVQQLPQPSPPASAGRNRKSSPSSRPPSSSMKHRAAAMNTLASAYEDEIAEDDADDPHDIDEYHHDVGVGGKRSHGGRSTLLDSRGRPVSAGAKQRYQRQHVKSAETRPMISELLEGAQPRIPKEERVETVEELQKAAGAQHQQHPPPPHAARPTSASNGRQQRPFSAGSAAANKQQQQQSNRPTSARSTLASGSRPASARTEGGGSLYGYFAPHSIVGRGGLTRRGSFGAADFGADGYDSRKQPTSTPQLRRTISSAFAGRDFYSAFGAAAPLSARRAAAAAATSGKRSAADNGCHQTPPAEAADANRCTPHGAAIHIPSKPTSRPTSAAPRRGSV